MPLTFVARSKFLLQYVRSVENPYLIYILVQYMYLLYRTNRDAQILIELQKNKNSRRTNLRFCVLENDTLQAYRLLFTS